MKNLLILSFFTISLNAFAIDLPDSLKSCKFQNIYKDHALTEVIINDNIGSTLSGCPREMIYSYSEYSSKRIQVLRLTHAQRSECWYGNVTCKTK